MPTEQIMPLALSGWEMKKAVLDKIEQALNRDCNLNNDLAYGDGFSFKVHIEIRAKDLGREIESITDTEGAIKKIQHGSEQIAVPADPEEYASLEPFESNVEQTMNDPTAARIETGQPVPIKTTDSQGKQDIRHAKYRRDAAPKR